LRSVLLADEEDAVCQRDKFHYPVIDPEKGDSPPCVYMCGNSLGLQPVNVAKYVNEELQRWSRGGVRGHFEGAGRHWAKIDDHVQAPMARVVGALDSEVSVMNGLSANIHLMFVPFYRPTPERFKIIMEAKAFPSDRYIVESQVKFHGYDPEEAILLISPREAEQTLRDEDVLEFIGREGKGVALVFLPGVHYYTGQLLDMQAITAAAHKQGCLAGYDLAHAVGNAVLDLHAWGVDFACWCTYKYLNAGPGAIGGVFVHERHGHGDESLPRFAGWWGHDEASRFDMTKPFKPEKGARGFQLSNPPILQCVSLIASLEIFELVGMHCIRRKAQVMSAYLLMLLEKTLAGHVTPVTPREPHRRGCQLSIMVDRPVKTIFRALGAAGVVCDMREPDVIRLAPCPLYNSFAEVHEVARLLAVIYRLSDAELEERVARAAEGSSVLDDELLLPH
jgi:kynureninase